MIRDVNESIARRGVLPVPVPARLTIPRSPPCLWEEIFRSLSSSPFRYYGNPMGKNHRQSPAKKMHYKHIDF